MASLMLGLLVVNTFSLYQINTSPESGLIGVSILALIGLLLKTFIGSVERQRWIDWIVGVIGAVIVTSLLGTIQHPKEPEIISSTYGLALVVIVAGLLGVWIFNKIQLKWIGLLVTVLILGEGAYLLASRSLGRIEAFYCFGIGLITAIITGWIAIRDRQVSPASKQDDILEPALAAGLIIGAMIFPFRLMEGYGIGVSSLGMLSVLPFLLVARKEINGKTPGSTDTLANAYPDFSRVVFLGIGIIMATAVLRVLIQSRAFHSTIALDAMYPLIGLAIGGTLPMVLQKMTTRNENHHNSRLWNALKVIFWSAAIPLLIAAFFGNPSIGGFIAGIIAAELFILFSLLIHDQTWTENLTLIVWMTTVTARFGPLVGDWSSSLARGQKINILFGLAVALIIWIIFSSLYQRKVNRK